MSDNEAPSPTPFTLSAKVREQVARELARIRPVPGHLSGGHVEQALLSGRASDILHGGAFDVHAARERACSLVALADEQTAFEDWTRGLGKGPENREPGAFRSALEDCGYCFGDGLVDYGNGDVQDCPDHCYQGQHRYPALGGWPGNLAREWARQGGDRRAPMGRSLAHLGQHVLDAIEGQPSECQSSSCKLARIVKRPNPGCTMCQGTGHNLLGYLPSGANPAL